MAWYDVFSRFYDASLEPHYREQRALAAAALDLTPDSVVLDLPCGTGQSLPHLLERGAGRILGVDLSPGMLRQARRRAAQAAWDQVTLIEGDATQIDAAQVALALGGAQVNRLHIFLGLSVFPDFARTFARLWALLAPGGRCAVVDVHAETLGAQGRLVNWLAGADIRRRFWEPLEAVGVDYQRRPLPSKALHGGQLWLATARKAG